MPKDIYGNEQSWLNAAPGSYGSGKENVGTTVTEKVSPEQAKSAGLTPAPGLNPFGLSDKTMDAALNDDPYWMQPGQNIQDSRGQFQRQMAAEYGRARYGDPNSEGQQALQRNTGAATRNASSYGASQMGLSKGGQQAMAGQMQGQIRGDAGRASQELLAAEQAQAKQRYADMLQSGRAADIDLQRATASSYAADQSSRMGLAESDANRSQDPLSIFYN